jgi:SAM-dependent methyltransferase
MSGDHSTAFDLGDLAVFDEAHLREVIATRSGAVSPALIGLALGDRRHNGADNSLARIAERIERALPPDERAVFAQARQQPATRSERHAARQITLDALFWDLTYWKTPEDYERLTAGEQVHLGALAFARVDGGVALDAGAGAGRVTFPLARRARKIYAMDPAPPLLRLLEDKLAATTLRHVELLRGVFRRVPLPDDSVDAAVSCSAFGSPEARGGQCGLDELRRVIRPGGRLVVMWPEDPRWFIDRGFHYASLPGHLKIRFPTLEDALAVARRFYQPAIVEYLETARTPEISFDLLGVKAPRDLCWITVHK